MEGLPDAIPARAPMMMAARAHRRGRHDSLVYEEAPRPWPSANEVTVRVDAAGITSAELSWDSSWIDARGRDRTSVIPAHDVSGMVVEIGSAVRTRAVGDEVYGLVPFSRDGAAAELVTMPAEILAARPRTISAVEAAALPLSALSAWQAVINHAGVQLGDRVLVRGAAGEAGAVGMYVVQIARWLGAEVVATAAAHDLEVKQSLDASTVLDTAPAVRGLSSNVDVVIDVVGRPTLPGAIEVMRHGSRVVMFRAPLPRGFARLHGAGATSFVVQPNRDDLTQIAALVDAGALRQVVSRVFPLAAARAAFESAVQGATGATVLVVREAGP